MQAKAKSNEVEELAVKKQDLVNAWLVLEKLVVSLDRIGSAYATAGETDPNNERVQQMYCEVGRFVLDQVFDDANVSRIPLGRYLADDEAEALSEEVEYWRSKKQ